MQLEIAALRAGAVPRMAVLVMASIVMTDSHATGRLDLPSPRTEGDDGLETLIDERRSRRDFAPAALGLPALGQLLWATQGITDPRGLRAAPSAGALYPLELFVVAGDVQGLDPGVYHYHPDRHQLSPQADGDRRETLARAAVGQMWLADAPATIVIAAVYERSTRKYGERGVRYAQMEAGHAGQNLFLQATALDLATVVVGAFRDEQVRDALALPPRVHPLSLMPVGHAVSP